jgi:hypothetical protein
MGCVTHLWNLVRMIFVPQISEFKQMLLRSYGAATVQSIWPQVMAGQPKESIVVGDRICVFFSTAIRPTLGPTKPPVQWVPGALSPGVKRLEHDA